MLLPVLLAFGCRPKVIVKTPEEFKREVKAEGLTITPVQQYCASALVERHERKRVVTVCTVDKQFCEEAVVSARQYGGLVGIKAVTECVSSTAGVAQQEEAPDSKPGQ